MTVVTLAVRGVLQDVYMLECPVCTLPQSVNDMATAAVGAVHVHAQYPRGSDASSKVE